MFRAISDVAVAMTVWSPSENPAVRASSRPCCLAERMSASVAIVTQKPVSGMAIPGARVSVEERESLLEIQGGGDPLEHQPELDHRERDLGLDADDDGVGAAEPCHVREVAQGADGEGVHDVERRDVHDQPLGAEP